MGDYFCTLLVVIYVCLNIKSLRNLIYFHTKICDSNNSYVRHGKNQPHEEVKYDYMFVNNSDAYAPPFPELIDMLENTRHFNYHTFL